MGLGMIPVHGCPWSWWDSGPGGEVKKLKHGEKCEQKLAPADLERAPVVEPKEPMKNPAWGLRNVGMPWVSCEGPPCLIVIHLGHPTRAFISGARSPSLSSPTFFQQPWGRQQERMKLAGFLGGVPVCMSSHRPFPAGVNAGSMKMY